jgi:hypothetical protein
MPHRQESPRCRALVLALAVLAVLAAGPSFGAESLGKSGARPPGARDASNGLYLSGRISAVWGPAGVIFRVERVSNTRAEGTTGNLRLALLATPTVPAVDDGKPFSTLATFGLGQFDAGQQRLNIDSSYAPYTLPAAGCYYVSVALEELGVDGFVVIDLRTLAAGGAPDGTSYDLFSFGGATCSPTGCVRSSSTACLQSGRFKVDVTYRSDAGTGTAQVMDFGGARAENDESVFLWFFDSRNFELGLKVLDGCSVNQHFWVFASGLTDQGWTANILDTQTGATASYSNPLHHLTSTVADTSALPCP